MSDVVQEDPAASAAHAAAPARRASEGAGAGVRADRKGLLELASLFLKLGATAFGGPAVHIAMMEDEVVRRRQWMSREEFLDLVGATNLIPGPNSTEVAIHVGHRRAGWPGLVVAGACFALPATVIVWALAAAYVAYGTLPQVAGLLYGVKPVVIAVVAQALWGFGRSALKSRAIVAAGLTAAGLCVAGLNEIVILFGIGLAVAAVRRLAAAAPAAGSLLLTGLPGLVLGAAAAQPFSLPTLFLVFVKIGSVLFGSGYVLLAFLRSELVEGLGWLNETQLLDAVAVGQFTPGPLSTTATFIGFLLGGHAGAALATLGMFLPAFLFVAISGPLVPRLRRSPTAGAFLDGVNVASLALMAVVSVQLAGDAVRDLPTLLAALASAVLLLVYRVNATWLILAGTALGLLASAYR